LASRTSCFSEAITNHSSHASTANSKRHEDEAVSTALAGTENAYGSKTRHDDASDGSSIVRSHPGKTGPLQLNGL